MGKDGSGMRWGMGKRKVQVTVYEATGTDKWIDKNKMRQKVIGLGQRSANFFCKGPNSKHFMF